MRREQRQRVRELRQQRELLLNKLGYLDGQIAIKGVDAPFELVHEKKQVEEELKKVEAEWDALREAPAADFNPYVGLRTFEEKDADLFFGRDALTAELVDKVRQWPFLAVMGPSGSGKSSVVRAGLLPELKGGVLSGSEGWLYAIFKPGGRPLDALAVALAQLKGGDSAEAVLSMRRLLAEDERGLLLAADLLLGEADNRRLVLVVDQAEELVTLAPADKDARAAHEAAQSLPFVRQLLAAVAAVQTPLCLIITLRADFLHRVAEYPELARWIAEHDVIVSAMTPEELGSAIYDPALEVGGEFEAGLAEELVEQVAGKPGALPLLEYTLSKLWEQRDGEGVMTWAAYKAMGGVEGALAARADAILHEKYGEGEREQLRHLLLKLIQPGEGALDSRRRALLDDLTPAGHTPDEVQALLKPLVDERLLTTGRDPATGEETAEVSHEALIRAWPTLREWIENGREDLRFQLQVEEAAREWEVSNSSEDFLWGGLRLENAEAWLARAAPQLSGREQRFLDASRAQVKAKREAEEARKREREALLEAKAEEERKRAEAERRNANRLRLFLAAGAVLLAIAIALGVFWRIEQGRARGLLEQSQKALRRAIAGQLALNAQSVLEGEQDPTGSLPLLLASAAVTNTWSSDGYVLPEADTILQRVTSERTPWRQTVDAEAFAADSAGITSISYRPGSDDLAASSGDGKVWLWNPAHSSPQLVLARPSWITSLAFDLTGEQLVLTDDEGSVCVWRLGTPEPSCRETGHSAVSAGFSPGGEILYVAGDRGVEVWRAREMEPVRSLEPYSASVHSAAFNADGSLLVTADDSGVHLWQTETGQEMGQPPVDVGPTCAVAFGRQSPQVLIGCNDGRVLLWNVATHKVSELGRHDSSVTVAAFSADDRLAVSGYQDGTAQVWDIERRKPIEILQGHVDLISSLSFRGDGQRIASSSFDGTVRIWSARPEHLVRSIAGHTADIQAIAIVSDQHFLATADKQGLVQFWDLNNSTVGSISIRHGSDLFAMTLDSIARHLLTGGQDGSLKLWDVASGKSIKSWPDAMAGSILTVEFSPISGQFVIAGQESDGGAIKVWHAISDEPTHVIFDFADLVWAVNFDPAGRRLIAASKDGTLRLYDTTTWTEIWRREATADEGWFRQARFSPDGKVIAAASVGGSVSYFDAHTGDVSASGIPHAHSGPITDLAFSSGGRYLATGGNGAAVRIWRADTGQMVRQLDTGSTWVYALGFDSSDLLITGAANGILQLWPSIEVLLGIAAESVQREPPLLTPSERRQYGLESMGM